MALSSPNRLRFGCPRCMTRLEAKPTQAGKHRRCPVCYHKLRVPTAEEVAAAAAKWKEPGYGTLSEQGAIPSAAAYQTYLTVVCGVCGTRMYASPNQLGQEIRCPDCETPTRVAPPAKPMTAPEAAPAKPVEGYPVYEGEGQPPRDHVEVYQRYIPVVCPICHTRMLATVDQVGQRLVCPDCETPSIVPPLEEVSHEPLPVPRRWDPGDVYDAQPSDEPTPPTPASATPGPATPPRPPAASQQYVVATCPVCHTRQDVTPDQIGKALKCPDCGTRFPVMQPKAPPPARDILDEIGEEYGLAPAPEVAARKPAVFDDEIPIEFEARPSGNAPPRGEEQPPVEERHGLDEEWKNLNQQLRDGSGWQVTPNTVVLGRGPKKRAKKKKKRVSFVRGIFNFPFYRSSLTYWLAMAMGLMFVVLPPAFAYGWAIRQPVPDWTWVGVAGALAAFAGILWSLMSSSTCLAILQDTAEGCDAVENWPEGQFSEWLYDAIYIYTALILSVALGAGVLRLLELADVFWWPRGLSVAVGVGFLAFPFLLTSMLEAGSPLIPFSLPILRSLFSVWWAWLLFYVEAILLVAVMAGLSALATVPTHLWGTPAALVLVAATLMIYFRLLGRLVWCCSHRGGSDAELPPRSEDDLVQYRPILD